MEITRVLISNFRCIKQAEIFLGNSTVFIGPNNVGKSALLDALRIALTRRWGQRGTGFSPHDIYLPPGTTDPKNAPPISVEVELQERHAGEWPSDLQTALDDIVQLNPVSGCSTIILRVTCTMDATTGNLEPQWQFLTLERKPVTGRGARSVNLQEFFQYLPVFCLGPLRDADDEFSARSQFWGRLLRAMNIPDTLQAKLQKDLDALNKELIKADPRLGDIAQNLKTITTIAPAGTPGDIDLRAIAMQPWEMLAKTEVIYRDANDRPWLPLNRHGQGIQSLAVIFLFDAFVKQLLATLYRPESTPILELEEPETHLHPHATKTLCPTILKLSGQKLITTHSPYFVQNVPFRDLRIVRLTDQGTTITWLPPTARTALPHTQRLDAIVTQHQALLSYDKTTSTLTANGRIDDDLLRQLFKTYATHPDATQVIADLKALRAAAKLLIRDDELAKLETWARRIRGEIFFARKWLLVEGQADYLLLHTVAALQGYPLDEHCISIIDTKNNGSPSTFASLARALSIPWLALFDGDDAGEGYIVEIEKRDFDKAEITNRCTLLPAGDMEEQLVNDGLEPTLRDVLARLGEHDTKTMPTTDLIEKLRKHKTEYTIEICEDLRNSPALLTKVPAVVKDTVDRLRGLQQ